MSFKKNRDEMAKQISGKEIFTYAQQSAFKYIDCVFDKPVYPLQGDLEKLNLFMEALPERGEDALGILRMLSEIGAPNTVAQTGGRYFGYVNGGALPITLAIRWMTDFWDQNAVSYRASPIASKIEEVCEQWIKDLLVTSKNLSYFVLAPLSL